ncbi:hypothetical protein MNBD_UNCLBAC01-2028 [hydrothermal vent metagenome]|uniref:WbqC-like protein family n=1 Tax=hydrothermal vent metagenome TaxID=652676 RepID=A0A3B1DQA2_9ZZZZ
MIATIHQPQYLPWLGYFNKVDRSDVFILLDDVQFKKNDWQNRNKICTSQGEQWLTVPVLHNFGQKINEVKIDNKTNWQDSHLKALHMNYRKAPFFDNYIRLFENIYQMQWELLVDINIYLIKEIIDLLGIQTRIVLSSEFKVSENSTKRLSNLCKAVDADMYLAGADGGKYMDAIQFEKSGVKLLTQDFYHPIYNQLWTQNHSKNFISNMSVVDLFFNYGPKSLTIIRGEK